jgi:Txe/YoeB family toxin of Txe-Axe toxin-antitoxin module
MEQKARLEILSKINVLEDFIKRANDAIIEKRKALELVQSEVSEKHSKINDLISETQNDLFKIAGQRYDILF